MLWSLGWIFLFGAVVMVALPAIAGAIGGSHVSNVVVMHINMAANAVSRMAASRAASQAAANVRGAPNAARSNVQAARGAATATPAPSP
jgi:hypothetical protein